MYKSKTTSGFDTFTIIDRLREKENQKQLKHQKCLYKFQITSSIQSDISIIVSVYILQILPSIVVHLQVLAMEILCMLL
jgi:hypothetical protein